MFVLTVDDFDGFLFHPGGRKVLETARDVLGLSENDLSHSWRVLRDYYNPSRRPCFSCLERRSGKARKAATSARSARASPPISRSLSPEPGFVQVPTERPALPGHALGRRSASAVSSNSSCSG